MFVVFLLWARDQVRCFIYTLHLICTATQWIRYYHTLLLRKPSKPQAGWVTYPVITIWFQDLHSHQALKHEFFLTMLNTSTLDVSFKTHLNLNIWALFWYNTVLTTCASRSLHGVCVPHLSFLISSNKISWGFVPLISQGEGLLNLNGPKWFQHRRLITPVFNFNILRSYIEVMAHSVNVMLVSEGTQVFWCIAKCFQQGVNWTYV